MNVPIWIPSTPRQSGPGVAGVGPNSSSAIKKVRDFIQVTDLSAHELLEVGRLQLSLKGFSGRRKHTKH